MKYTFHMGSMSGAVLVSAIPAFAQGGEQPSVPEGAGIIAWIVVGLIDGFLASKMVNKTGEGILRDILLGIVGGVIGGIIFSRIRRSWRHRHQLVEHLSSICRRRHTSGGVPCHLWPTTLHDLSGDGRYK